MVQAILCGLITRFIKCDYKMLKKEKLQNFVQLLQKYIWINIFVHIQKV